jgi:hypothetical protein
MAERAIAMMASEPFEFHGRKLAVFACFDATPAEAKRLIERQLAVIRQQRYQTADVKAADPEPEPQPQPQPARRRYKRRDLKAETH